MHKNDQSNLKQHYDTKRFAYLYHPLWPSNVKNNVINTEFVI